MLPTFSAFPRTPILVVLCCAFALLWTPSVASAAPADRPPDDPSAEDQIPEKGDVPDELPEKYRTFLEEVELLMTEEEWKTFLSLEEDYERDAFIERFWRARDPEPRTARNEFKDRWDARVDMARRKFDDPQDERREMLLKNGPPDVVVESRCNLLVPLEAWAWARSETVGHELAIVFYKPEGMLPYRIWQPVEGLRELFDRFLGGSARPNLRTIALRCPDGDKLAGMISWVLREGTMGFSTLLGRIDEGFERPSDEWVKTFESYTTRIPEGAGTFDAELEIGFPGRRQNRTVTQGMIAVPTTEVSTAELAGSSSYNLVLNGEVLLDGALFETFRYKFDYPTSQVRGGTIPLVFERALRPDEEYTLVLKVEDLNSGRFYRAERTIRVPEVEERMKGPGPEDEETARLLQEANAVLTEGQADVRLIRPQGDLLTNMVRFSTMAVGEQIDHVTFSLNGEPVLTDKKPPFSVELDLGTLPRTHSLRAEAFDADGEELASDEILVNAGGTRFRVHLTSPRRGKVYRESVRVAAELEVPAGKDVDRMEIFVDETKVATLYDEPWAQPVVLPESLRDGGMGYVRAVAYLDDGNSTEDTVFINAPDYMEEVDVQFVELYATILGRDGRPVDGLTRQDFRVYEEDEEQQILRFEQVRDQPIHTAILMDVSASMSDRLEATQDAAVQFYQQIVRPKDRASLITFNDYPNLAVKFTNEVDALAGGLAGLKAERGTALWDSVIFSLYYFNGVKGQKALLILSDGEDEASRFDFEEALEYARRAGVTVYTIGLTIPRGKPRRQLTQIAEETGGRSYFIDSTEPLAGIYSQVEEELRSQYLIAYQSSREVTGGDFRRVRLEVVGRPDVEVKTMTGYYP